MNKYDHIEVVVRLVPVFTCSICGTAGRGDTAQVVLNTIDPEVMLEAVTNVSPTHLPVGWACNGREDIRCQDHVSFSRRPKMLSVSPNLRTEMPAYDTPELADQWLYDAMHVLIEADALEIPCCMGLGTRRMLFQVARAMGAKSVLDIGTYIGFSALTFALALPEDGKVVTVDIKHANAFDAYWYTTGRAISPNAMMEIAGVRNRVEFVTQSSVDYLRSTSDTFDFICIDGHHEAPVVYEELELAMSHLNPGGLIFMDDIHTHDDPNRPEGFDYVPGPWQALQLHLQQGAELEVLFNTNAFESAWTATAFLLRKAQ